MIIYAPYEGPETVIRLPDPELSNEESPVSTSVLRKSMTGKRYSYNRTNQETVLNYTFESMSKEKYLELIEFMRCYITNNLRLVDHNGTSWKVKFQNPTMNYGITGRSLDCNSLGGRNEQGDLQLSFIGMKNA